MLMLHKTLIERVRTELLVLQRAEARYADVLAPEFDPFDFFARSEMRLSQVIAWMLNPRGTHAQGTRYLTLFLNACAVASNEIAPQITELDMVFVGVERPLYVSGESVGRIDIEVSSKGVFLLVENKPDANFGPRQLERYREVVKSSRKPFSRLVVLRGWGEHSQRARDAGDVVLGLGTEVATWVESCAQQTNAPDVRSFLERLRQHLVKRFTGLGGEKELDSVLAAIGESPESVQGAIEIASALPILKNRIISEFYQKYSETLHTSKLSLNENVAGEPRLPNKSGALRVKLDRPTFDFTLACDRSDLNDASFGICLRKENRSYKKTFARERDALFQAWGAGDGGDGNEWWVWWDALPNLVPHYAPHGQAGLWASFADFGPKGMLAAALAKASEARRLLAPTELPH
jgi:hypothetical protein